MAEHVINSVTLAVTGELTSKVLSGLIKRYGKDAATSEKLQQLDMLLIKIHSAVEASEKYTLENPWLLRWRDKLKEAASQGDEVLARFLQQARDSQASSSADANHQQGEAASSFAATPTTAASALSYVRNSLSGIVQGIHSARKMMFVSGGEDIERLNKILVRLEKLSPDIREFIRLVHLEASPRLAQVRGVSANMSLTIAVHRPAKTMRKMRERRMRIFFSSGCSLFGLLPLEEKMKEMSDQCLEEEKSVHLFKSKCDPACLQEEQQGALLPGRLEAAFSEICKAVELSDCHNLDGLQWLAYWNGILWEAKEQGWAILDAITACKNVNTEDKEELVVGGDQEKHELISFVRRQEGLARDVEYFKKLVYLCPAC